MTSIITVRQIDINRKSADPAGTGTQVYDNIATVGFAQWFHWNRPPQRLRPDRHLRWPHDIHDGFFLAGNSPVGKNAASDGTDAGVYAGS